MRICIYTLLLFLLVGCGEDVPITFNPNIEEADLLIEGNRDVRRAVRKKCRTEGCVWTNPAANSTLPDVPETVALTLVESSQGDRPRYDEYGRWCVIKRLEVVGRKAEFCRGDDWYYPGVSTVHYKLVEHTRAYEFPKYIARPPDWRKRVTAW